MSTARASSSRQPREAPPHGAMRAPTEAHTGAQRPGMPLSIERRDTATEERSGQGTQASATDRWSRWHRPPRSAEAGDLEGGRVLSPTSSSALEKELAETRQLLLQYTEYVEDSVMKDVATLESQLSHASEQCERYRKECERLSSLVSGGDRGCGARACDAVGGIVLHSDDSDDEEAGHHWQNGDRKTVEQLRLLNREQAAQTASLTREVAELKAERHHWKESRDSSSRSPQGRFPTLLRQSSQEPSSTPEVLTFLETIANDGEQFAAALCRLGESVRAEEGQSKLGKAPAARGFTSIHANWQETVDDVRQYLLDRHKHGGTSSAPDLADLLSSITHAQSQEHLRLVESLQTLFTENRKLRQELRTTREEATALRDTVALRSSELEEDHQAELQMLQSTIRELESRLHAFTSVHNGGGPHAGASPNSSSLVMSTKDGHVPGSLSTSVVSGAAAAAGAAAYAMDTTPSNVDAGSRAAPNVGRMSDSAASRRGSVDGETQTPLSLEFILAALARNAQRLGDATSPIAGSMMQTPLTATAPGGDRSAFSRAARREREMELVDMLLTEVEALREDLATVSAERNALREQRDRFLCQVESPYLDYRRRLGMAANLGNDTMSL